MATISYESYYGTSIFDSPYLVHHGVKGQKWGVRNWQYQDGSLTPAGRVHYGYGNHNRTKKDLSSITDPYDTKQIADYYGFKKYNDVLKKAKSLNDEHVAAYKSIMNEIAEARYDKNEHVKNAIDKALKDSGFDDDPEYMSMIIDEYKELGKTHSLLDERVFWNYVPDVHPEYLKLTDKWYKSYYDDVKEIGRKLIEEKGRDVFDMQVDLLNKEVKDSGKHFAYKDDEEVSDLMSIYLRYYMETLKHSDDYLMHHGTKGMKWYHRRYQNEDGSLTALGRIHYGIGKGRKEEGAKELVDAYDAKKKEERSAKKAEREEVNKQKILTSGSAAEILKNSDKFTNQELQQAIQRIDMKTKLSKMYVPDKSAIETITDKLNKYGNLVNSITNIKNNVDKLADAFTNSEEKEAKKAQAELEKARAKKEMEAEVARKSAIISARNKIIQDDINNKLSEVIKKAREEASGSDDDIERSVKLATEKFLSSVDKANNTDKKTRLQKLNEAYKKLNDDAKMRKAQKAQNEKNNESYIEKLSRVSEQYEAERNGPRDSQAAWDRFKSIANEVSQNHSNNKSTSNLSVKSLANITSSVKTGVSSASSLLKSAASKLSTKSSSFDLSSSSGKSTWNDLSKSNSSLLERSISEIMDDDKK